MKSDQLSLLYVFTQEKKVGKESKKKKGRKLSLTETGLARKFTKPQLNNVNSP